jgi:hypothetical protein
MLRADFCEKCIIVHFLGAEKDEKRLLTRRCKVRGEIGEKTRRLGPQSGKGGAALAEWARSKQRPYSIFRLSRLLAHTCTADCRKSFISTHMGFDPGGWGTIFCENELFERWAESGQVSENMEDTELGPQICAPKVRATSKCYCVRTSMTSAPRRRSPVFEFRWCLRKFP